MEFTVKEAFQVYKKKDRKRLKPIKRPKNLQEYFRTRKPVGIKPKNGFKSGFRFQQLLGKRIGKIKYF